LVLLRVEIARFTRRALAFLRRFRRDDSSLLL
jgi:hypothetical protein